MSASKRLFEETDVDPFTRCQACGEYEDVCICGDVATEGHVFYPGDESALAQALDSYLTRTPSHPDDDGADS